MKPPKKTKRTKGRKQKPFKRAQLWAYGFEDGTIVSDVQPSAEDIKAGWWKPVALLDLSASADAARIEAGAKAIYRLSPLRGVFTQRRIPWGKLSKPWQRNYITQARVVLRALGALSTPGEKKKGEA